MNTALTLIDWILYVPLSLCVLYLLVYAIASKFYRTPKYPPTQKQNRFLVLFPAYKEDRVIVQSVRSFLEQDYPKEMFNIIVISDQMKDETNEVLRSLPIRVLIANYENSSKAKALSMAADTTADESYDLVVIMDADNITTPNFLQEANRAREAGVLAMQAHRTGKNLNTPIALLDAVSEEINNGFFRSGHHAVGFSSGLAGSGMVFCDDWFRANVKKLQTSGEDKELEALLLRQRIHIAYLSHLPIYDEKTQKQEAIGNQRKRWIAAQFGALRSSLPHFSQALFNGNFDYCDKILQWMLPPRLVQLAAVFFFTGLMSVVGLLTDFGFLWSLKWWMLFLAQVAAMVIPIPTELLNKQLLRAVMCIPGLVIDTIANLFKLKGANKKFIHTQHGE